MNKKDSLKIKKEFLLREFFVRFAFFVLGISIISAVCSLYLVSNIGNDCFSSFMQGIAKTFGISYGVSSFILHLFFFFTVLVLKKSYIKLGTVVSVLVMPLVINFITPFFSVYVGDATPYWIRFALCSIGCIILSFGLALVIDSNIGVSPYDTLPLLISSMIKKQYFIIRLSLDFLVLALGFLLGGKVGLFTFITFAAVGPLSQLFRPASKKMIRLLIGGNNEQGS